MPEGISRPRSASGRCSVYFRVSLVKGILTRTEDRGGSFKVRWRVVVEVLGGVEGL